jgi:tRNA modification GTPase
VNTDRDTIAAIATAPGVAGISIVRVSGPRSLEIADAIFKGPSPSPSQRGGHAFVHGYVRNPARSSEEAEVDEVVLLVYRSPHSYTREDVVEIQGHGGRTSAGRVLQTVIEAGARHAEPGEFTKRAFLNGRIDLLQAEAIADLISAQSERAARAAMEQLDGGLSSVVAACYDDLIAVAADLEATIDFVEQELPETTMANIIGRLGHAISGLNGLLSTWHEGHLLREGAVVVIAGRPNVGKSTMLNTLLRRNRAIVTDVPGTTRDTIEETLILDGIPVRLVDTAGLRDPLCAVEEEGIIRTRRMLEQADLILYVIDSATGLHDEDKHALSELDPNRTVVVANKSDIESKSAHCNAPGHQNVRCSMVTGAGLPELKTTIVHKLGVGTASPLHASISARHRQYVQNALNGLNDAYALITSSDESMILPATNRVRDAVNEIGKITGQVYTDELLNEIFSKFCVGK